MATAEMIRHGRRQGTLRSPGTTAGSDQLLRPGQVTVVDTMEWERIKGSLSSANRDAEKRQAQLDARRTLHERSKATVKNWENTIEGQRLKKLQARKIREDKEEAERVKVDLEEAQYQAERRKEAIERAKTLLYYQTDRAKQFHGALLLSEVLRERDAQVEYKGRKEQRFRAVDDYYARQQEEERERGALADMKAAGERAKAKTEVARYQIMQATERERVKRREREEALNEQAQLEKEVAEFHSQQKGLEEQHRQARLVLRDQLDHVLSDKRTTEGRKMEQEQREDGERKVFTEAKKKMTRLRKEKEREIFQEFQTHQQRMCDRLHHQMQQMKSDEDERIAKAVTEQEAKREREERQKEEQFVQQTREIFHHRQMMIAEKEKKEKEKSEIDQELLKQRIIQDQKFHSQQLERHQKVAVDARELQDFYKLQMSELERRKEVKTKEEQDKFDQNMTLLQVEEDQFQQYASKVIAEAKKRGAHIQPLRKAAKAGAGGGHGPVFTGKGGICPSYQVMDSTVVELPSYQPKIPRPQPAGSTQKRMGFTW